MSSSYVQRPFRIVPRRAGADNVVSVSDLSPCSAGQLTDRGQSPLQGGHTNGQCNTVTPRTD